MLAIPHTAKQTLQSQRTLRHLGDMQVPAAPRSPLTNNGQASKPQTTSRPPHLQSCDTLPKTRNSQSASSFISHDHYDITHNSPHIIISQSCTSFTLSPVTSIMWPWLPVWTPGQDKRPESRKVIITHPTDSIGNTSSTPRTILGYTHLPTGDRCSVIITINKQISPLYMTSSLLAPIIY